MAGTADLPELKAPMPGAPKAPLLIQEGRRISAGGWLQAASRRYSESAPGEVTRDRPATLLGTGRLRAAETLAYTSPRIKRLVQELGIKLMSYAKFCKR
jgi:hypothetical protein